MQADRLWVLGGSLCVLAAGIAAVARRLQGFAKLLAKERPAEAPFAKLVLLACRRGL